MNRAAVTAGPARPDAPLPWWRAAGWIALYAVREMARRRRLAATAAVGAVPVALVVLWRILDGGHGIPAPLLLANLGGVLYVHFGVVIAGLAFGLGAVGEPLDDGTLLYYWTRPVGRGAIYGGRVLAAQAVAALLVLASLVGCFLAFTAGNWGLLTPTFVLLYLRTCLVVVLGAVVYTALFALLGTAWRRPLLPALALGFGWETLGGNTPLRLQRLTVVFHLRNLMDNPAPDTGGMVNLLQRLQQGLQQAVPRPSPAASLLALLAAVAVTLLLGQWLLRRRELSR